MISFFQNKGFFWLGIIFILSLGFYFPAFQAFSQTPLNSTVNDPLEKVQQETDFKEIETGQAPEEAENLIGTVLNFTLGLTLTFFIVGVFIAGFIWMTSEGNEEKTKKAKTLIFQSSLGLGIVFFAYLIAYAIIAVLSYRTGFQVL